MLQNTNMLRLILAGISLLTAVTLSPAQDSNHIVEVRALLATDATHPGSTAKAAVVAQIAPGYHINDHKPSLEYLIPTELKLDASKHVNLEGVSFPNGSLKKLAFSDSPLSVYEGRLVVGALLKVAKGAQPGAYKLEGKFSYQACNDHACLPPASIPLALTVRIVSASVPLKRQNADVFNKLKFE